MYPFRRLAVWGRSRAAALATYHLTRSFPRDELFGLVSQLRRAAVSVAANIAEGSKRLSGRDFARFLNVAEGSAAEMECLLELSRELRYAPAEDTDRLATEFAEIQRMLCALRRRLARS